MWMMSIGRSSKRPDGSRRPMRCSWAAVLAWAWTPGSVPSEEAKRVCGLASKQLVWPTRRFVIHAGSVRSHTWRGRFGTIAIGRIRRLLLMKATLWSVSWVCAVLWVSFPLHLISITIGSPLVLARIGFSRSMAPSSGCNAPNLVARTSGKPLRNLDSRHCPRIAFLADCRRVQNARLLRGQTFRCLGAIRDFPRLEGPHSSASTMRGSSDLRRGPTKTSYA
mmetsp:Transcript_112716/g.291268  ORF Transcript_112716/g.291268 Transcript_112716/m.291268 type:complete len:222 (+) Transcript_112716:647-1312(+)